MTHPLDSAGKEITVGANVYVSKANLHLCGYDGKVLNTDSEMYSGSLGPIAVFFDKDVPSRLMMNPSSAEKWEDDGAIPPNSENYLVSPRVVCFEADALTVMVA